MFLAYSQKILLLEVESVIGGPKEEYPSQFHPN